MIEKLESIEQIILQFIYDLHVPIIDKIMIFITNLANHGEVWIILGIILLLFKKHRKAGLIALMALLFMLIINDITLKNVIERQRPFYSMENITLLIEEPDSFSFPSGHTASSFAVAFVLYHFYKKYSVLIFGASGLMAFTRLYLTVHYPTDIIGGILIGYLCSWLAFFVYNKISRYLQAKQSKEVKKAA